MNDRLIYKAWKASTSDLRYLRPNRWKVIKDVILKYNLKSVIEFGSGVSTILFDNLGMHILSFETRLPYMKFVTDLCPRVPIIHWDNVSLSIRGQFDLALVDGDLPRTTQLDISLKRADFIAIDDFIGQTKSQMMPSLEHLERLDKEETILAMFDNRKFT